MWAVAVFTIPLMTEVPVTMVESREPWAEAPEEDSPVFLLWGDDKRGEEEELAEGEWCGDRSAHRIWKKALV